MRHDARPAAVEPGLTSVVVLAWNQLEYNRLCVESVLAHSDGAFELILVDNGSTDGTAAYFEEVARRDPRVRTILNQRNWGFAIGCNQGLALARGEYLVLLNNDTVVPRGWLGGLRAHLEAHPEVGAVGPISNSVSGPQLLEPVPFANDADALPEILAFGDRLAQAAKGQGVTIPRLVGFCLMVRREVLNRIGGFDPRFGIGNFEDDDFCVRLLFAGYQARVAQDVYVHHFGSKSFAAMDKEEHMELFRRNWALFQSKWATSQELVESRTYTISERPFHPFEHHVPLPELDAPGWRVVTPVVQLRV